MYLCTYVRKQRNTALKTKKHSPNTGARGCTYIRMHVSRHACMYGMHLAPLVPGHSRPKHCMARLEQPQLTKSPNEQGVNPLKGYSVPK